MFPRLIGLAVFIGTIAGAACDGQTPVSETPEETYFMAVSVEVTDAFGVPVADAAIAISIMSRNGSVAQVDSVGGRTDSAGRFLQRSGSGTAPKPFPTQLNIDVLYGAASPPGDTNLVVIVLR